MISLLDFQAEASKRILDRYIAYSSAPVITGTKRDIREVAFFQFLSSLTASGKTVMMADVVAGLSTISPVQPIVLWLSRGRVVVKQTFASLSPGGRYNHLLQGAEVRALADFDHDELRSLDKTFVYLATVGTFAQGAKEESDLLIYNSNLDHADASIWDQLKVRLDSGDRRRPLIVVYDEAHNLSDLQTKLLLEQEPDAFILASATMRLPARMESEIQYLRNNGWSDDDLITHVSPAKVAASNLVKSTVALTGYRTPMVEAVAQLLKDKAVADAEANRLGAPGPTKAIYVCNTNIVEGDSNQRDNPKRPFGQREAPPILIWRYLTEQCGVDPDSIAVYCSLSVDKKHPLPDEFHLFKGAASDYASFLQGDYQHIIFNLTLQEGWDDPLCYFAYIDKSMESRVAIEQVIGRVLRQPEVKRYGSPYLNTANFYVRVDRNDVFSDIISDVEGKLRSTAPDISFVASKSPKERPVPVEPRIQRQIPMTALLTHMAAQPIQEIVGNIHDYTDDSGANTESKGARATIQRRVGEDSSGKILWEEFETSSAVLARWIFVREVRSRYPRALEVALTSDPKFDARIGLGSKAEANLVNAAQRVVDTYLDEVIIKQKVADPFEVGPVMARSKGSHSFKHSVHPFYDGLNPFEVEFAEALDETGLDWFRNPPRTGYGIPLVSMGPTQNFFPDFVIWTDKSVLLVDTKGEHLINEAVARKLLNIQRPENATTSLQVHFVSKGRWRKDVVRESPAGYSLWGLSPAGEVKVWHGDRIADVVGRLLEGS